MSFDFSSTTSDDASVVDISVLLTGDNTRKINNDEYKNISSLLHDTSSKVNIEHKINYPKEITNDDNRSELKHTRTTATKELLQIPNEEADVCHTKRYCDSPTIRVVMGESVKTWRTQRNLNRLNNSTPRTLIKSKPAYNEGTNQTHVYGNSLKSHAKQTNYIVIQQRDTSSDPKINEKEPSRRIHFENSHLNVERSTSDSYGRIDIVEATSTGDNPECTNNQKKNTVHKTKTCKCQFAQYRNQSSSATSTFVDCIAIWDPKRGVYVLEVPELIASDITTMPSSDDDHNITDTGTNLNLNGTQEAISGNLARRRRKDPLEQQRQAETKLLNQRKRRRS